MATRLAHAGHTGLGAALHAAASRAFFDGFHTGDYVAAGVAAAGALMALALIPAHPTAGGEADAQTSAIGSPALATVTG